MTSAALSPAPAKPTGLRGPKGRLTTKARSTPKSEDASPGDAHEPSHIPVERVAREASTANESWESF
jgi:hypothetical protein